MTSLEVFGAVCGAMQTIEVALTLWKQCREFYDGCPPAIEQMKHTTALIDSALSVMQDHICHTTGLSNHAPSVVSEVAASITNTSSELRSLVDEILSQNETRRVVRTATAVWRYRSKKIRLETLKSSLTESMTALLSFMGARHLNQADAIIFKNGEYFDRLSSTLQAIVTQIAKGEEGVNSSLETLAANIREGQTNVSNGFEILINRVDEAQTKIVNCVDQSNHLLRREMEMAASKSRVEAAVEALLESLRFERMWEREADITSPDTAVFEDAFHGLDLIPPPSDGDISTSSPDYQPIKATKSEPGERELEDRVLRFDRDTLRCSCGTRFEPVALMFSKSPNLALQKMADFYKWLERERGIFWISGLPGSGKSTLVKLLVSRLQTETALKLWAGSSGTVHILRFYIWELGSNLLQKSYKGLLCCILHQILSLHGDQAEFVLAEFPDSKRQKDPYEWDKAVMKRILTRLLTSFSVRYCFFIDALDELASSEDVDDLMVLLGELRELANVKICVASRAEEVFKTHLRQVPTLKIHNLTLRSMMEYATQQLRRTADITPVSLCHCQQNQMVDLLVTKAEGVFLWLKFVLENIRSGIITGETWTELRTRLEDLPRGMNNLYSRMWQRTGEFAERYCQYGVEYINLVLAYLDIDKVTRDLILIHGRFSSTVASHRMTLGHLLEAKNVDIQRQPCPVAGSTANPLYDLAWVNKKEREVATYCAGFLILKDAGNKMRKDPSFEENDTLRIKLSLEVHFLHRSASDFFRNTAEGKLILQRDPSCVGDRYLKLLQAKTVSRRYYPNMDRSRVPNLKSEVGYFISGISLVITSNPSSTLPYLKTTLELLQDYVLSRESQSSLYCLLVFDKAIFQWLVTSVWPWNRQAAQATFLNIWGLSSWRFYSQLSPNFSEDIGIGVLAFVEYAIGVGLQPGLPGIVKGYINDPSLQTEYSLKRSPLAEFIAYLTSTLTKIHTLNTRLDSCDDLRILSSLLLSSSSALCLRQNLSCGVSWFCSEIDEDVTVLFSRVSIPPFSVPEGMKRVYFPLQLSLAGWCRLLLSAKSWPIALRSYVRQNEAILDDIAPNMGIEEIAKIPLLITTNQPPNPAFAIAELGEPESTILSAKVLSWIRWRLDQISTEQGPPRSFPLMEDLILDFKNVDDNLLKRALSHHFGDIPKEELDKHYPTSSG